MKKQANASLQTVFSYTDRIIFDGYLSMADAVARLIGSFCEVVVHSLEEVDHSVVKIVNGNVSGRTVGAPLTNLCFGILEDAEKTGNDVVGPYYSLGGDGRTIRSITTVLRGEGGRPIGLICFNMDLSCPLDGLIREYAACGAGEKPGMPEIYPRTVEELIRHMLGEAITAAGLMKGVSSQEKNAAAIKLLLERGVFSFKGSVEIVAKEMGLSRTSVYNYMRACAEGDASESE